MSTPPFKSDYCLHKSLSHTPWRSVRNPRTDRDVPRTFVFVRWTSFLDDYRAPGAQQGPRGSDPQHCQRHRHTQGQRSGVCEAGARQDEGGEGVCFGRGLPRDPKVVGQIIPRVARFQDLPRQHEQESGTNRFGGPDRPIKYYYESRFTNQIHADRGPVSARANFDSFFSTPTRVPVPRFLLQLKQLRGQVAALTKALMEEAVKGKREGDRTRHEVIHPLTPSIRP